MERFRDLIDVTVPMPIADEVKTVFGIKEMVGDSMPLSLCGYGQIVEKSSDEAKFILGAFVPYSGVQFNDASKVFTGKLPCNIQWLTPGMRFGFKNALCDETQVDLQGAQAVWVVSEYHQEMNVDFYHLFSGGFCGWSKALEWKNDSAFRTIMALDCDEDAVQCWALQNCAYVLTDKATQNRIYDAAKLGIVSDIADSAWICVCCSPYNSTFSLSPPCTSWSMGGKGEGLLVSAGMTFLHAIEGIKCAQPIFLTLECADQIVNHPHFKVVKEALRFSGYREVWSQVVPLHNLADMYRTRWLALWVRTDFQSDQTFGSFRLTAPSSGWDDPRCCIFVPDQVAHQLLLDRSLRSHYADYDLLPQSMRSKCKDQSPDAVLKSRIADVRKPLPTLCAMYTRQHKLSIRHLRQKGIYASILMKDGSFQFLDPMRYTSLLGATNEGITILPCKIDKCFLFLGNSISVSQAQLVIQVMIALAFDPANEVTKNVVRCWEDRVCATSVVVLRTQDWIIVAPKKHVVDVITMITGSMIHGSGISFSIDGDARVVPLDSCAAMCDLAHFLGIENPAQQNLVLKINGQIQPWSLHVNRCVGHEIEVWFDSSLLFRVNDLRVELNIPITVPDSPSDESIDDADLLLAVIDAETKLLIGHDLKEGPVQLNDMSLPREVAFKIFVVGSEHPLVFMWPDDITDNQISLRLQFHFNRPDGSATVPWIKVSSHDPACKHFIIADPRKLCSQEEHPLLVHSFDFSIAKVIIARNSIVPKALIGYATPCVDVQINGNAVEPFGSYDIHAGDVLSFALLDNSPKRCHAITHVSQRIEQMIEHGPALATDEFDHFSKVFKAIVSEVTLIQPACKSPDDLYCDFESAIEQLTDAKPLVLLPIITHNHWCACEIRRVSNGDLKVDFLNVDARIERVWRKDFIAAARKKSMRATFSLWVMPTSFGWCGWELMHRWLKHVLHVCTANPSSMLCLGNFELRFSHDTKVEQSLGLAGVDYAPLTLLNCMLPSQTAMWFRSFNLANFRQSPTIRFGNGTEADDDMESKDTKTDDPWKSYDPWMQNSRKQCKWEDLSLPRDHAFCNSKQERIPQVHRHQLNNNVSGISFCTRSSISEILQRQPKEPFALLVPASDKSKVEAIGGLIVKGPYETIVCDSGSGGMYKRQVLLVQTFDNISFSPEKPKYVATLTKMCELVLEAHVKLLTKDSIAFFKEKALDAFRAKANDQFPQKDISGIQIYAFRALTEGGSQGPIFMFQAMCKVNQENRKSILRHSGLGDLLVRDFVPKGESVQDLTFIPKFWQVDRNNKSEIVKTCSSLTGFAGVAVVRKGLTVRAWCSDIVEVRRALLAGDTRIIEENIDVIPRVAYQSTGWPLSIGAADIVKAVKYACGQAPIPSRCFRSLGVVSWTLNFASVPKPLRFSAMFNSEICEILLTPCDVVEAVTSKQPKGAGKGKKGKSKTQGDGDKASCSDIPHEELQKTNDRISSLEGRFTVMEKRQEGVEAQLSSNFDAIQNQLRQVIHMVQPRAASPSKTGFSPPTKQTKLT